MQNNKRDFFFNKNKTYTSSKSVSGTGRSLKVQKEKSEGRKQRGTKKRNEASEY